MGLARLHEKVLHRLAGCLGVTVRSPRSLLESRHIVAGLPEPSNPHVRGLSADTKKPRQLGDVNASTFRLIPAPLPLEH